MPPDRQTLAARILHGAFETSLVLKGLFAASELAGGVLLWMIGTEAIVALVERMTFRELTADPADWVATRAVEMAHGFSVETKDFYAAYLAVHGIVKLALVFGLWREYRWAFPAAVAALAMFIAYQLHRYAANHSPALLALSLFDAIMIWLIWREYRATA